MRESPILMNVPMVRALIEGGLVCDADMRNGQVTVYIKRDCEHLLSPAAESEGCDRTTTLPGGVDADGCNAQGLTE